MEYEVTEEDIFAAQRLAAELIEKEKVYPLVAVGG